MSERSRIKMKKNFSEKLKQITIKEFAQKADSYDSAGMFEMVKADYDEIIDEVLKEPYETLIDYGCGTGEFLNRIYQRRPEAKYTGVDITPEILEVARKKNKEIEFVNGDSEAVSFSGKTVNVITCIHSFHHYTNPGAFIANAFASLHPGGRLIIRDNSSRSRLRYLWMNYVRYPISHLNGKGDVHFYSLDEVKMLGESFGFVSEIMEIRDGNKLHCVFRKLGE